jgi:hypothetical protein
MWTTAKLKEAHTQVEYSTQKENGGHDLEGRIGTVY